LSAGLTACSLRKNAGETRRFLFTSEEENRRKEKTKKKEKKKLTNTNYTK